MLAQVTTLPAKLWNPFGFNEKGILDGLEQLALRITITDTIPKLTGMYTRVPLRKALGFVASVWDHNAIEDSVADDI